jgi:lipoprotein signal peptidase
MRRWLVRFSGSMSVALTVVFADQVAKATVAQADTGAFKPAHNTGFVTGWSPVSTPAVVLISVAVLVGFLAIVGRWAVQIGVPPVIPALIGGGMAAHTLDRIRFGGVRDFIPAHGLIWDLADVAVVTGFVLLCVAFVWRSCVLHRTGHTITLVMPTLKASVVPRGK